MKTHFFILLFCFASISVLAFKAKQGTPCDTLVFSNGKKNTVQNATKTSAQIKYTLCSATDTARDIDNKKHLQKIKYVNGKNKLSEESIPSKTGFWFSLIGFLLNVVGAILFAFLLAGSFAFLGWNVLGILVLAFLCFPMATILGIVGSLINLEQLQIFSKAEKKVSRKIKLNLVIGLASTIIGLVVSIVLIKAAWF